MNQGLIGTKFKRGPGLKEKFLGCFVVSSIFPPNEELGAMHWNFHAAHGVCTFLCIFGAIGYL